MLNNLEGNTLELLTCQICGVQYPNLTQHIRKHKMTVKEYKEQFGTDRVMTREFALLMRSHRSLGSQFIENLSNGVKASYDQNNLRQRRSEGTKRQMENQEQRELRKELMTNRNVSESTKLKLKKAKTTSKWGMLRQRLYERANGKCEICGISEINLVKDGHKSLVIHEKNYDFIIPKDEDCVLCCSSCHKKLHNKLGKSRAKSISRVVMQLLNVMKIDTSDDNFYETPRRFTSVLTEFSGIEIDFDFELEEFFNSVYVCEYEGLICETNIRTYALCPHHLLPITYDITIAYLPNGYAVGVSKLSRLAELLSKRLQLQESLVKQIADSLIHYLGTDNVAVIVRGEHDCMKIRGVEQPESSLIVSEMRGAFRENQSLRMELLDLIKLSEKR